MRTVIPPRFDGAIDASWESALEPVAETLRELQFFLDEETAVGRQVLPAPGNVLRALQQPLDAVRVLIVGQDPYPNPGHAVGLSFAVDPAVRPLPRSLQNIYQELADDLGIPVPEHGDLAPWQDSGVMLLNRVLTVCAGHAGSHRRRGWEQVTDAIIRALATRQRPLVAILWGKDADATRALLGDTPVIASAHPSPLSAARGFFGSRPFTRTNELLIRQGGEPVNWALPS